MTIRTVRNLRRASQTIFLALFIFLLLRTGFSGVVTGDNVRDFELSWPVKIFLQFDPLVAISTMIATASLYTGLIFSLIIVILTIFFGRFFCGWICPMGTINQICSSGRRNSRNIFGKTVVKMNRWHWYQHIKYFVLIVLLGSALVGSVLIGLFDPLSLLIRSLGLVVIPMLVNIIDGINSLLFNSGFEPLSYVGSALGMVKQHILLNIEPVHYNTIVSLGVVFFLVLISNRIITRFWCRAVCPLGALLGLLSRWSILGMERDESKCTNCNLCLKYCQGGDDPIPGLPWKKFDCHLCLNCQAVCPEDVIKFKLFPRQERKETIPQPSISRRKVVLGIGGGVLMVPFLRSGDDHKANFNAMRIRPPGSVEEDQFLERCVRCGECMKVCPNNAIHPTLLETGWEALWTPILIMRIGYCEHTCTLCSQTCPTGAIRRITLEEKVGSEDVKPISIGTAFIDRGRCLPWAMDTPCIVCEEWCPTSPKAIYFEEVEVTTRDGEVTTLKRPHVDPDVCIGCGACEFACPVIDKPAVYVTSVGESRSRRNQILLERNIDSGRS